MWIAIVAAALMWASPMHQQLLEDLDLLTEAGRPAFAERPSSTHLPGTPVLLAALLIRFYQRFISPQDLDVCNFTPSCSSFALQAITRYGLMKGALLAADRLLRCHSLTYRYRPEYYARDERTGKLIDPVERYR